MIAVESDELKRKILLLRSDLTYIESIARNELGMVKKGDIVYLPGEILERGTEYVIMDGIDYPCIRYALILGKCTPTAEETQSLKFKVEEKAKAIKGEKPLSLKN